MKFSKDVRDLFMKDRAAWVDDCRAEARKLLKRQRSITIEDVLKNCPRPEHIKPNITGSVFQHPDFVKTGAPVRAKHRLANGHWISRWRLSNSLKRSQIAAGDWDKYEEY